MFGDQSLESRRESPTNDKNQVSTAGLKATNKLQCESGQTEAGKKARSAKPMKTGGDDCLRTPNKQQLRAAVKCLCLGGKAQFESSEWNVSENLFGALLSFCSNTIKWRTTITKPRATKVESHFSDAFNNDKDLDSCEFHDPQAATQPG